VHEKTHFYFKNLHLWIGSQSMVGGSERERNFRLRMIEPEVAHFSLQFEDRVMKAKHVE